MIAALLFFAIPTLVAFAIATHARHAHGWDETINNLAAQLFDDRLRDTPVADALADAVAEHIASGSCEDIISYTVQHHPSGAVVVRLVTAGDLVDAAERWLE